MKASDEDLIAVSESQLGDLLGLYETAIDVSVKRYPLGLPEYRVGHRQRMQAWHEALEVHSTLALAGNYLDGVGLPDCVRSGRKAIKKLRSL